MRPFVRLRLEFRYATSDNFLSTPVALCADSESN